MIVSRDPGRKDITYSLCGLGSPFDPEGSAARAWAAVPPGGRLLSLFTDEWALELVHANKTYELRGLQLVRRTPCFPDWL